LVSSKKYNAKLVLVTIGMLLIVGMSIYYISDLSFIGRNKSILPQEAEVIKQENKIKITANTDLVQKILYLKCNDEEVIRIKPTEKLIGLTVYQLQNVYQGWVFDKVTRDEVQMTLKIDGYCREHINNMFIGIHDGRVAVFYGKPDSKRIVKEVTNIQVNKLMAQDVEELQKGLVVSSTEELLSTLEGMQAR